MSLQELDRLLAPLDSAEAETRSAAAKTIGELGPNAVVAIAS